MKTVVQCDNGPSACSTKPVKVILHFTQIRCLLLCGYLSASPATFDMHLYVCERSVTEGADFTNPPLAMVYPQLKHAHVQQMQAAVKWL